MTQSLTVRPDQQVVNLSIQEIKQYICPTATDAEALMFLRLAQAQNLNPFLREVYLIKYGNSAATIVVGKEAFTKRAEEHPQFAGFRAGIIVNCPIITRSAAQGPHPGSETVQQSLVEREGTLLLEGETLLGGWAEVYRNDRKVPYKATASMVEYDAKQSQWKTRPATMIRKVALVQALREAFPTVFRGLYDASEMGVDAEALPDGVIEGQAREVPPAATKAQLTEINDLLPAAGWDVAALKGYCKNQYGCEVRGLNHMQAGELVEYLQSFVAKQPEANPAF